MWSVHNACSLPFLSPHTLSLLQHKVPLMGDSPSQTCPMCVLPMGGSSSGPFHRGQSFRNRLLQHASLGEPQILARRPAPSSVPSVTCRGPMGSLQLHSLHHGPALWVAGKSLLQHLEYLLPVLLLWPWCLQSCFFHILLSLSLSCCSAVFFTLS